MMENTGGMGLDSFLLGQLTGNKEANGNGDGIGGNNGMLWIFLLLLFGMGGFGGNGGLFGNKDGAGALINDASITAQVEAALSKAQAAGLSDQVILEAIKGNGTAIQTLATTLNCDMNSVKSTLSNLQAEVGMLGVKYDCGTDKIMGAIAVNGQQITNVIQSTGCDIRTAIDKCCCQTQQLISNMGYENRLAMQDQTSTLSGLINSQSQLINAQFCALKEREDAREIQALRDQVTDLKNNVVNIAQTQTLTSVINNSCNPTPVPAYIVPNNRCGHGGCGSERF